MRAHEAVSLGCGAIALGLILMLAAPLLWAAFALMVGAFL